MVGNSLAAIYPYLVKGKNFPMKVWPGKPYPLGATWDGAGVNFALFSENAEAVELCFFRGPKGKADALRIRMTEHTDQVWQRHERDNPDD